MKNKTLVQTISFAAFCFALCLSTSHAQAKDDNRELVRVAQIRLADLGYHAGRFDGVMGDVTESAIKNFQMRNGLAVTGMLTPETYSLLTGTARADSVLASYQAYEDYYRNIDANRVLTSDIGPVAWADRWHFVNTQRLPLRYANLTVREENDGPMRHYQVMVNGHSVLLANDQPGLLRASETFTLNKEDAVIFTAYQTAGACPNRSYLLVIHDDGSFNRPQEIGNCAGNYNARVVNNALFVDFPSVALAGGWQTWGTWRYENSMTVRL